MNIPVFLSYSRPYTDHQQEFIDRVREFLASRGLESRTLGVTDYDMDEPLTAIRRLMLESNGLLAIAFRRYHIEEGAEKVRGEQGEPKDRLLSDQYFSSAWCQIEPAMAFQLGLPILIFREKGVIADGVLEKGVLGTYLPEFDLTKPIDDYLKAPEWNQIIAEWEGYVRVVRKVKGKPPRLY